MLFRLRRAWLLAIVVFAHSSRLHAVEVSGTVRMPPTCSPVVSPAVVRLEPCSDANPPTAAICTAITLVNQRGLRFEPRVSAMTLGQALRFGNDDAEQHNIHILTPGASFNQSMAAGQRVEFVPRQPGILRLTCDIHSHMRGYVVVGTSPWVAACDRSGAFTFRDVPEGRYRLIVWHEMGEQVERAINVHGRFANVGTIEVEGRAPVNAPAASRPIEPWSEVIDRIGMILSMSLDAAQQAGGRERAVARAQDAYFAEFEASDMETAVRASLGLARSVELERQFRAVTRMVGDLADHKVGPSGAGDATRLLIVKLYRASQDLNSRGVTDRAKILDASPGPSVAQRPARGGRAGQYAALEAALGAVQRLADQGRGAAATEALGEAYFDAFEPLESDLRLTDPETVRNLEMRFNALRGEIGTGVKGQALAYRLEALRTDARAAVDRFDAQATGTFGLGFAASLGTILREGVEVILILTMLFALVAKAGHARALASLRWGVGLAVVASLATALALNLLVGATRGRTRELIEALVMLAASGVLFYVSYWLISQSESQRWLSFLKSHARKGAELGGYGTLGLTAFLAVYREGAETALMYQALLTQTQQTPGGRLGIVAGLVVGLVLLGGFYVLVRSTSVRLPLKRFFQVTGGLLFGMAVIFAGHGVFELQSTGIVKATALRWLGRGLPALGLYPNLQCLAIQGILLAGALLALVVIVWDRRRGSGAGQSQVRPPTAAGVGV